MTKRNRHGAHASVAIGLPALVLATSCVPADRSVAVVAARPERDARTLLHRMALNVPDDIATRSPPAKGDALSRAATGLAAPPFLNAARSLDDAARATDCLTAAVYYEARSQSHDGQRAVAQVVLNRVRDRAFPNTICGVVYQGSARDTGCQFSFTCDGSMDRPREPGAWQRARGVAAAALAGSVYAPVGAATSYHASSILPWWAPSLTRIATVGAHVFYRWRGSLESALTFRQAYAGIEPIAGRDRSDVALMAQPASRGTVAVHYGNAPVFADVTIHRGKLLPVAAPIRTRWMSGVRIHVGHVVGPSPTSSPEAADAVSTAAIVADES